MKSESINHHPHPKFSNGEPQIGLPKTHALTMKHRGLGSLQCRRIAMGLTRQALSDLTGEPLHRLQRVEAQCAINERDGRDSLAGFTLLLLNATKAYDEAESAFHLDQKKFDDLMEDSSRALAMGRPTIVRDRKPQDVNHNMSVSRTGKELLDGMPEGTIIKIILPNGIEFDIK